jgi:protein-tyrosine-phosphatase
VNADPSNPTRTVLFVCAHGAGRSRLAAAFFNADPPAGWHATTAAGEQPAERVNPDAVALLDGTTAAAHLDLSPPRALNTDDADVVVAIDCDPAPGAVHWRLTPAVIDEALRDELHHRVAALRTSIAATIPPPA